MKRLFTAYGQSSYFGSLFVSRRPQQFIAYGGDRMIIGEL
jgi:hypothetical protein